MCLSTVYVYKLCKYCTSKYLFYEKCDHVPNVKTHFVGAFKTQTSLTANYILNEQAEIVNIDPTNTTKEELVYKKYPHPCIMAYYKGCKSKQLLL